MPLKIMMDLLLIADFTKTLVPSIKSIISNHKVRPDVINLVVTNLKRSKKIDIDGFKCFSVKLTGTRVEEMYSAEIPQVSSKFSLSRVKRGGFQTFSPKTVRIWSSRVVFHQDA